MPNGGLDNCWTCWFNSKNRVDRHRMTYGDNRGPSHCQISDQRIKDPGYTYCANHAL